MMESTWQGHEFGGLFESWLEMSKNFWQMESDQKENAHAADQHDASRKKEQEAQTEPGRDEDDSRFTTYRTWETAVNNYTTFLRIMATPESQRELGDGIAAFSEVMAQTAGDALEQLMEFQGQVISSFTKVCEHTTAYTLDGVDHAAFESFRDLYRSEFQKYLNVPKIGLPREFHERISNLADSTTLFSSYLSELLCLFVRPIDKTNMAMQQKISHMLDNGECEFLKDPKKTYGEWIKNLEDNFMEMLKSDEYTTVLNDTIISLATFKNVRQEVMSVILKDLQIPTDREMDEVYKDLYQMKKKIQELTRQVESLRSELVVYRN